MEPSTLQLKPKNAGTKQLFDNPLLEKLSRTHIAVPIGIFLLISAGLVAYGATTTSVPAWLLATLYVTGIFVFTFVEYTVHRRVFHMLPSSPSKANLQYKIHGVHHEYPKDKSRLAMPPVLSVAIASLLLLLFKLLLGDYMFGFLPGFLTGYAAYLFVHYAVHAFRPPNNVLKVLWINHGIHHYKNHDQAFGVSSPLWDWVFGTLPTDAKK